MAHLRRCPSSCISGSTRQRRRHRFHLQEWVDGRQLDIVKRSALGAVSVCNMLPGSIVEVTTVSVFQSHLQSLLRYVVESDSLVDWPRLFSPRHALAFHPLLRFQLHWDVMRLRERRSRSVLVLTTRKEILRQRRTARELAATVTAAAEAPARIELTGPCLRSASPVGASSSS